MKGYQLKVVLPTSVSVERRQLLELWGAEIIESPGAEGSNGAVRKAQALSAEHPEWVFLYQYGNPANPSAHYEGTGPEIWRDCPEVTHFVAGLGTSGTLLGVGRYLKERNPAIEVWAVEPPSGETVEGLRNLDDGYVPPIFEEMGGAELLDRKSVVRPRESIDLDAPAGRSRAVRRALHRRGDGRGRQVRVAASRGHGGGDRRRLPGRRMEVPVDRSVDRRPRRGRRAREDPHLLLSGGRTRRSPCSAVTGAIPDPAGRRAATWSEARGRRSGSMPVPGPSPPSSGHLDPGAIDAVVLSHEHPDHWSDLESFAVWLLLNPERPSIPVYAPPGLRARSYFAGLAALEWIEAHPSDTVTVGRQAGGFDVRFVATDHGPPTLAVALRGGRRPRSGTRPRLLGRHWARTGRSPSSGHGIGTFLCEATYTVDRRGHPTTT